MVTFTTANPAGLLAALKKEIDDKKMKTWIYDEDGDFQYIADQWEKLAFFRPSLGNGFLNFRLDTWQGKSVTLFQAAVYHGRFIEIVAAHFPTLFTSASSSDVKAFSVAKAA